MKRPLSQEEMRLVLDIVDQNAGIVEMNYRIISNLLPQPEIDSDDEAPTLQ